MPTRTMPFLTLPAFDPETNDLNVIIETPKGSRNKYKYDVKRGLFELSRVLPAGSTFPYDFGYIPSTRGEDGDPLDVLVLMDEAAFPGCRLAARLIGVLKAEQTEDGDTVRNDRLIAVASESRDHRAVESIDQLEQHWVEEIEHFFVSYHETVGEKWQLLACQGPDKALKLVHKGMTPKKHAHSNGHARAVAR